MTYPESPNWPVKERHWELAVAGVVLIIVGVAATLVENPAAAVGYQHPYASVGWFVWLMGMTAIAIGMLWPKPGAKYT